MKNQATKRGRFAAVLKGALAGLIIGAGGQMALGQNLLQNGDFSTGLSNWKTDGDVTAEFNHGVLKDTGTDPVLYQAVAVSGYAYELRFDIDLEDVSDRAGSGEFDSIRMVLYEGTDAATLGPDTAAQTSALIEGNASGLTALVDKAQIAPNPVLGLGYASAVVEFISEYAAIAPGVILFNKNGMIDSTIRVTNVRLIAIDRGRLANISNRGAVGTDPDFMIPSFVLKGPDKKRFVIRGAGPWLAALGVQGTLDDPAFSLKTLSGLDISGNNDWGDNPNQTELIDAMTKVGAWGIPFADGSNDAALLQDEGGGLEANAYSIILEGRNLEPGDDPQVALAEVYDYDVFEDGATELVNISNRGRTSSGAGAQIPGFVISGDRGRIVLIRAVGPSLAQFVAGTLDDPILLLNQNVPGVGNQEVARNDDYHTAENADQVVATSQRIGAFALLPDEADSAILMALEPGVYTAAAQVKGDDESGVVLVEVYLVSDNTRPQAAPHVMFVGTQQSPPSELDMEQILNPLQDGEGDLLTVASFSQPQVGTVTEDDDGLLLFANDIGFVGQTYFNYTLTDGEYESAPGVIGLNVAPFGAKVWIGGSSSSFSDPDNWMDGQVPGDGADVWIVPVGEATVNIDQDVELKTLRVGGIGSEVELTVPWNRTLGTTGTMDVGYGSTLTVQGTVDTGDHLRIAGTLEWTSGTMAGDASTVIEPGGKAELSSGGRLELADDRDFLNRGKVLQSGNAYILSVRTSNSVITNAADADWDVASSGGRIAYSEADSSILFTNAGDLYKSSATGQVIYGYSQGTSSFANQVGGRVIIEGGTLEFQGAGTGDHSGELTIADGAEALFTNGGHTFNGGSVISDTGTVIAGTGSTVSFAAAKTLESLRITNNGTVNHSGTLTVSNFSHEYGVLESDDNLVVTGELLWKGGTQDGSGDTLVEDGATAILTDTYLYLNGDRTFTNQGEVSQRSNCRLLATLNSQSVVTNADGGIWNLEMSNGQYMGYSDANSSLHIVNNGILNKQDNQHTYYIGYYQGTNNFTNTGSINVPNGIIQFEGASNASHEGTLSISSNAEVLLNRGTHSFGEDAEVSDTGTLTVGAYATVSMPDPITLQALKVVASGTLTLGDEATVANFTQTGGTVIGSDDLLVTTELNVSGGTHSGTGETILGAAAEGTISNGPLILTGNRGFTNRGELTLVGTGNGFNLNGNTQSTVTNAAGATMTSNLSANYYIFYAGDSGSTANFVNEGALIKENVSTLNYFGYSSHQTNLTNASTGTITVEGGVLQMRSGGTSSYDGTVTIEENAELYFYSGTHNFLIGGSVANSGLFHVGNATVAIAGSLTIPTFKMDGNSGSVTAVGNLTVENFEQGYGTFSSTGDLTVSDTFIWTRGNQTGSGKTVIGSEATATLNTTWLYLRGSRQLVNNGDLDQNGSAGLYVDQTSNCSIINAAGATWTVNVGQNQQFASGASDSTLTFTNLGTLVKINQNNAILGRNGGTQNFTNAASGMIDVQAGKLYFDNKGTGTHQGTLTMATNAEAWFRNGIHSFQAGSSLGSGSSLVIGNTAASVTFAEAVSFEALTMTQGTLANNANVTVNTLSQTNGIITGSGNLIVKDTATFSTGSHEGSGTTIFDTGSTLSLTSYMYLESGRAVELRGTTAQSGNGYFYARGGLGTSTVTNSGTVTMTGTRLMGNDSASTLNYVNNGTITKTSANTCSIGSGSGLSSLTNNGTLEVQTGSLSLGGACTLDLGAGGTARLTTAGQTSNKVIDGSGTIKFNGTLQLLLGVGFAPTNNQTVTVIDFGNGKGSGAFSTLTQPSGYTSITQNLNATNMEITFFQ